MAPDGRCAINRLDAALNDYFAIRRSLGFERGDVAAVGVTLWRFSRPKALRTSPRNWRFDGRPGRLKPSLPRGLGVWGMVRRFAAWHTAMEPRTEIPPARLLPHRYQRIRPHIYPDKRNRKASSQSSPTRFAERASRPHLHHAIWFARREWNAVE
jgi:hypothetical protein